MKIAVISDIHGNFPALETVVDHLESWRPDRVFVAGDTVNRGPRSHDCWKFIHARSKNQDWKIIRGNHEDFVLSRADPEEPKSGPRYELSKPAHFTYQQLDYDVSDLKSLPQAYCETPLDYGEIRMVHASMHHNRDGIYPESIPAEIQEKISPPPEVFITGHTHRPFIRKINSTLVVNAGSVGLPFDGDPRTGYAQISTQNGQWKAQVIRLTYDIAQAEKNFYDTGYLNNAGPMAKLFLLELELALSQLYQWFTKYSQPVLKGKISVAQATEDYLREPSTKPYW